ncbi:MAG TPA: ribosome maturation factor RimP [Candidatus Hydrogenedentes bacterium]|nr:ribosome maturation factor RimP [Candidatus Hydrogenedentota bacterium]
MEHEVLRRALWELLEPELARIGYELIEVELAGSGSRGVLRVFIDKPGGITLDDCVAASRQAELVLDASDLMTASYTLEMSSPGSDRPLRKPAHFERYTGRAVRVQTHAPVLGRQRFTGVLAGVSDGMVLIQCEVAEPYRIHFENIKKARLEPPET